MEKLAALESALPPGIKILRASEIPSPRRVPPLPTGVARLDALLSGGLPRGKLLEIVGGRSSGRFALGISVLSTATGAGENAAFVDLGEHFDPRAARSAGAELDRILWIRPKRFRDAVLSAEIALSAGFPLVVADLGVPPLGGRVPDASWVRLARAAEGHGSALLLLAPYPVAGPAPEAVVTLRRRRAAWSGSGDSPRLLVGIDSRFALEKRRGERPGRVEETRFHLEETIAQGPPTTSEGAEGVTAARAPAEPAGRPNGSLASRPIWPEPRIFAGWPSAGPRRRAERDLSGSD